MSPTERLALARTNLVAAREEYERAAIACKNKIDHEVIVHVIGYLMYAPIPWGDDDAAIFDGYPLQKGGELWFKMSGFQEHLERHGITIPLKQVKESLNANGIKQRANTTVAGKNLRPWVMPLALL